MANLSGAWLGTYWQKGKPTRFEVTLLQTGNAISGSILDDSALGEATLNGEVIGRNVSFIKRYLNPALGSVRYVGTLSEEEKLIQGKWRIDQQHYGTWEARRMGENLTLQLKAERSKQAPLTIR